MYKIYIAWLKSPKKTLKILKPLWLVNDMSARDINTSDIIVKLFDSVLIGSFVSISHLFGNVSDFSISMWVFKSALKYTNDIIHRAPSCENYLNVKFLSTYEQIYQVKNFNIYMSIAKQQNLNCHFRLKIKVCFVSKNYFAIHGTVSSLLRLWSVDLSSLML